MPECPMKATFQKNHQRYEQLQESARNACLVAGLAEASSMSLPGHPTQTVWTSLCSHQVLLDLLHKRHICLGIVKQVPVNIEGHVDR